MKMAMVDGPLPPLLLGTKSKRGREELLILSAIPEMDHIHIVDASSSGNVSSLHQRRALHQQNNHQSSSQPRTVLEEEEYTSTLTHIVTRDYYPALHTLRRDAAILDARGKGDISGAVAIRRKFRSEEMQREREWVEEMQEEEKALALNDEDECNRSRQNNAEVRKYPRPLKHESITGFHARVTSEDNAEFEMNQERERKEREEFLSLVYDSRADKGGRLTIENQLQRRKDVVDGNIGVGKQLRQGGNVPSMRALCDTPIGLSSDLFDAPPSAGLRITNGTSHNEAITRNGIGRNGLFFQPQHHNAIKNTVSGGITQPKPSSSGTFLALESTDATGGTIEEQDSNIANTGNRLMPPPPARFPSSLSSSVVPHKPSNDETTKPHPTKSTPSIDHRHQLVEYLPKPSLPDIHPPATRFPYQNESRLLSKNNGNMSSLYPSNRDSLGGSIGSYSTDASDTTDLDESPRPLHLERAAYKKARLRENETFLPMTPLIRPGRGGDEVELDSNSPQVVGSGSLPSTSWEPTFDVVDENSREKIARKAEKRIVERSKTYRSAGSSKKGRTDKDDESVTSSRSLSTNPFDRRASLTPAARALLEASTHARKSTKKSNNLLSSSSSSSHPSRIFSSSSAVSGMNAGSRDSLGSSLRMSYTPNRPNLSRAGERDGKQSTSAMRLTAGGATPR